MMRDAETKFADLESKYKSLQKQVNDDFEPRVAHLQAQNTKLADTIASGMAQMNNLHSSVAAKDAQILALQAQMAEKDKIIADVRAGGGYTAVPTPKKKRQSTDPAKFDGKGSPAER